MSTEHRSVWRMIQSLMSVRRVSGPTGHSFVQPGPTALGLVAGNGVRPNGPVSHKDGEPRAVGPGWANEWPVGPKDWSRIADLAVRVAERAVRQSCSRTPKPLDSSAGNYQSATATRMGTLACPRSNTKSGRAGVPILQRARTIAHARHRMAVVFLFALSLVAFAQPTLAHAQPGDGALPKYKEMTLPSGEDLLKGKPFDWIVLRTEDVLVAEPVAPRHDPVMRLTLRQKQAEATYSRVLKYKPARLAEAEQQLVRNRDLNVEVLRGEVEAKLTAARDRVQETKQAALKLSVTLRDDSVDPDYQLETRFILLVVHYEDLVLRRVEQLIDEGRVPLAYDLLLVVNRRHRENNVRIQTELEADEKANQSEGESLKARREELRKERDQLKTKPRTGATKKREMELDDGIDSLTKEIKDLDEELLALRKKLRFVRPKDFPRPDAPLKDDVLLPAWPKFEETYTRLILKDAELHATRNDFDGALRLLEEIWKPGSTLMGLSAELGRVIDHLIAPLVERHDYRQARHFLNRLATREPDHAIALKWKNDLTSKATAAIGEARAASARGEAAAAAEIVDRAARIWPEAPGLKEAHRELTDKHQSLRVGVMRLPGGTTRSPFLPTADDRARLLTTASLFDPNRIDDQGVRYRSAFFETWEPTDLGRQVRFTLKLKRADWESRPVITSADVYAELSARLDRTDSAFDERLAGFVSGMTVQSPSEFTVHFRRLPLRLESLWQFTAGGQPESQSFSENLTGEDSSQPGRQRFTRVSRDERQAVFRRVRPQPTSARQRHVDEIVEIRYDSWETALQGLLRGEVAALPHADLRDLKALQDDGRFFVMPYALPQSHFLMFQPKTAVLRDSQLRRAILHAIPRERLLSELVLKDAPASHGRLVTGPFASKSYGYNRLLEQPAYDPQLAAALALAAKQRSGGTLPTLKLSCPSDPVVRETARVMIENWKRVGLDVRLLDDAAPAAGEADDGWDICYRTARFIEPVADIWPLLTLQTEARVEALQPLPERTRRVLLELERTIDWTTATKLLHRLLADLLTEARYVPLWEVDEYLVVRRNLVGLPTRPMHAYDDVERWTLQSWYPQETP